MERREYQGNKTPMKITNINSVYCRPETDKEKALIFDELCACLVDRGKMEGCAIYMPDMYYSKTLKGYTEVTVKQFRDLVEDKIEGWRLEELDFEYRKQSDVYALRIENIIDGWVQDHYIKFNEGYIQIGGNRTTITKFSELLQLIRFMTIEND